MEFARFSLPDTGRGANRIEQLFVDDEVEDTSVDIVSVRCLRCPLIVDSTSSALLLLDSVEVDVAAALPA